MVTKHLNRAYQVLTQFHSKQRSKPGQLLMLTVNSQYLASMVAAILEQVKSKAAILTAVLRHATVSAGWFVLLATSPTQAWSLSSLLHVADEETIHYRATVTLSVDGVLVSGSAVQELRAFSEIRTLPGTGGGISVKGAGEAIVVDIPGGGAPLFFPLLSRTGNEWADYLQMDCGLNSGDADPVRRLDVIRDFRGPCSLPPRSWPLAVRFEDEGDPNSGKEVVFPEQSGRHGEIRLISVTIERSEEPLTTAVDRRLRWAAQDRQVRVDVHAADGRLILMTNSSIFIRR